MINYIFDKTSGIITRATTDEAFVLGKNEDSFPSEEKIDIGGYGKKVDTKTFEVSDTTKAEVVAAGLDEETIKQTQKDKKDAYILAIQTLAQDGSLPANLKNYFQALLDLT